MAGIDDLASRLAGLDGDQIGALLGALDGPAASFTPLPGPQQQAYESKADELLFGGAAGGSKSYLLLGTAATRHQRSLILRRQSTELDGLVADLVQMLGSEGFNRNDKEHVGGGRSIKLGGCREAEDWRHYAGRARDLLAFDEAAEFEETQVSSLLAWNRSIDPQQRCRLILASNPPRSAEGEWLVRWFEPWLDPGFANPAQPGELRWFVRVNGETRWVEGPGRVEVDGESYTARSRTFVPAKLVDNPYLDRSEYRAGLENLPEPLRSQLLKGDFTAGREDDAWQVIPSSWVAEAQSRWAPGIPAEPMTAMGVDVAQGGPDATVLAARHGTWFAPLRIYRGVDTKDGPSVAGLVFSHMRDGADIAVDAIGWGSSAFDHLRGQLPNVHGIVASEASMKRTKDMKLGFVNKRAELYWKFREALDPVTGAGIALPPDQALAADLAATRWKYVSRGIQCELKEDVRRRLGRSPDRADAVIMAWHVGLDRDPERIYAGALQTVANVGYERAKRRYGSIAIERPAGFQGAQPPRISQTEIVAQFERAQTWTAPRSRPWRR